MTMPQRWDGAPAPAPSHVRLRVLGFLCVMSFILYLDRICISQAAARMEEDLEISHTAMGFVFGSLLGLGLFQVPTGNWGDRYGAQGADGGRVLWSLLTMLTGLSNGLVMLLVVRFLFGAGAAGAFRTRSSHWGAGSLPAGAVGPRGS